MIGAWANQTPKGPNPGIEVDLVMIELQIIIKAHPHKTRTMTEALQAMAKNVRAVPGCLSVELYKRVGSPCHVCYDEVWESETALRQMIVSRHFSQLAALMELSTEPPYCQFRFISKTQGLEFAQQVRNSSNC